MSRPAKTFVLIVALLVPVILAIQWRLPAYVEKSRNRIMQVQPYPVTAVTKSLHEKLFVSDLHADSLLWDRDLSLRADYGHVDLPRLQQAGVALQVFSVVTRVPRGHNYAHTEDNIDNITFLAIAQGWPHRTWGSLLQRALYQAERLDRVIDRSRGGLVLIRNQADLRVLHSLRKDRASPVGALLALEGAHALEGRLENLDRLYQAGFRMIGLTHFFDNEAGGSAHGAEKPGLTEFGRSLVFKAQQLGMLIDLAHASDRLFADVLKVARGPVIVSHTGVRGTCDQGRNLSDLQLKGIAASGGVVGIAMFEAASCGNTLADTVRAMRHAVEVIGVDHVALGSDFDGSVATPVDATGLPMLTGALMNAGFSRDEIGKIMGGNVLRLLETVLPVGAAAE